MSDKRPPIAENPSFVKLREDIDGLKLLAKPEPLLRLARVKIDDDLLARINQLDESLQALSTLPDRFNDLFADRGWIAYGLMNAEVMLLATKVGEAGDLDAAEQVLVEHYDEATIDQGIKWLQPIRAFRRRERLARLALDDYLHERYHACVPVLLMIVDGVVNEVHGSRGFFAEAADLTAWDSIAAHSRGLQSLKELWCRKRKKTTGEPLTVPYRHGILHGQDLGYDNKLVAAKVWAALFAIREWALAVRDGRLEASPPQSKPSLTESLAKLDETRAEKERTSQWAARSEEDLAKIPEHGAPEDYDPTSPEASVVIFLHLWKRKNFGDMARLLPPTFRERLSKAAGEMRAEFVDKALESFEIREILDKAPAISEITVTVNLTSDGEAREGRLECRVLSMDEDGDPVCRGTDRAGWFFWPRLVVL